MNQDTRETIPTGSNFYPQVKELFDKKQKAALLYEDNGVTRANGFITDIFEKENQSWLRLDNGNEIAISGIYAINGTFASDYSEC